MSLARREFLRRSGLSVAAGTAVFLGCRGSRAATPTIATPPASAGNKATGSPTSGVVGADSWQKVREQFNLSRDYIHMAGLLLAPHPKPVREAIETHRRGLDENPVLYLHDNFEKGEMATLQAAADYLGVQPSSIALTESTTMGIGLVYNGIELVQGQEVLCTQHDHYSTFEALRLRASRTGATIRRISLYKQLQSVTVAEIVESIKKAITAKTRVLALTWVHSSTGLKLPIADIAAMLRPINSARPESERILLCVDGVHGFGVDNITMAELGCDFFMAGCHKWMFGPRGTGLVWGSEHGFKSLKSIIPSFAPEPFEAWKKGELPPANVPGPLLSPGGFHAFEHRWALAHAFRFHLDIGKAAIAERIHALNRQLKEEMKAMSHITLHTPMADELSAGLICFDVKNHSPKQVVEKLLTQRIIASTTPYATEYARLTPGLLNSNDDVKAVVKAVGQLV